MLDPHSEIELFGDRFCWNANELCNYVNGSSVVIEGLDLARTAGRQGRLFEPNKTFLFEGLVKYHTDSAI